MLKKTIATVLLAFAIIPNLTVLSANAAVNTEVEKNPKTLNYKYWRLTDSDYYYTKTLGGWEFFDRWTAHSTGQTYSVNFPKAQKGTISIGISVGNDVVAASIGYTPGSTATVYASSTSPQLTAGQTISAYYQCKELVYKIYQAEYEKVQAIGRDEPTGVTKTGQVSKPSNPDVKWQ